MQNFNMAQLGQGLQTSSPLLLGLGSDILGRTRNASQQGLQIMQAQAAQKQKDEQMRAALVKMGVIPPENQPGQVTSAPLAAPDSPMSPAQALAGAGLYEQALGAATAPQARDPEMIQYYRQAVKDGFQGSFMDFAGQYKGAGATRIENNLNAGSAGPWQYGTIPPGWRANKQTGAMEPVPGGPVASEKASSADNAVNTAQAMIDNIDAILADEALPYATGIFAPLQNIPGTGMYRFGTRARQLQGKAFLQAFESLKGGGQITQIEGEKATAAIGRLDTAQNEKDYVGAMNELKGILQTAQERALRGPSVPSVNAPDFGGMSTEELRAWIQENGG